MAYKNGKYQAQQHNFIAAMFLAMAVGVMYFHFQAVKATADTQVSSRVPPPPEMPTAGDEPVTEVASTENSNTEPAHLSTLKQQLDLLESGIKKLDAIPHYTSIFSKREEIDGVLHDEEIMELKLRHKPFSVYMKWTKGDVGRELLFQENMHEGMMLVQLGGTIGRFMPTLKLDINGDRAKSESRYPVCTSGLKNIAQKIADMCKEDIRKNVNCTCKVNSDVKFDNRPCHFFITEYQDKTQSEMYRRSEIYIDQEWNVPVCVRNYTWFPADRVIAPEETLIEEYAFTNINFKQQMADQEFEKGNDEYRFR